MRKQTKRPSFYKYAENIKEESEGDENDSMEMVKNDKSFKTRTIDSENSGSSSKKSNS